MHLDAIPSYSLPYPPSSWWGKPLDYFTNNDSCEHTETVSKLREDRALYCANIASISERMAVLWGQMELLEEEKSEAEDKVYEIDSVLHIIRRVPDDILREIFLFCVPVPIPRFDQHWLLPLYENEEQEQWELSQQMPWVIASVCRRWRALALDTSAVWAVLNIETSPGYDLSMLKLHASRARQHATALRISAWDPLINPMNEEFDPPSCCTDLQIFIEESSLRELFGPFIRDMQYLSSLDLSMGSAGNYKSEEDPSFTLCHESVRLRMLGIDDIRYIARFHIDPAYLVCLRVGQFFLDERQMEVLRALSSDAPALKYLTLSDAPNRNSPNFELGSKFVGESADIIFPMLEGLHIIQTSEEVYDPEESMEGITSLLWHLRLPILQSFSLQVGTDIYNDAFAPFARSFDKHTRLVPHASHLHIILKRGYTDLIKQLFSATPHITSLTIEPFVFPDLPELLMDALPLLERLEIETGICGKPTWSHFTCLIKLLETRRESGLTIPRVVFDVVIYLDKMDDGNWEDWQEETQKWMLRWRALRVIAQEMVFEKNYTPVYIAEVPAIDSI